MMFDPTTTVLLQGLILVALPAATWLARRHDR
jgi:hypothetical protein